MSSPGFQGLYISVSQLKCYLSCPMKYRLRYVEGVTPAFMPLALAFGTAFHKALGFYYGAVAETRCAPELDELVSIFNDAWQKAKSGNIQLQADDETSDTDPSDKAATMLAAFIEHAATGPLPEVEAIEHSFAVDVHDPDAGAVIEEKLVGVFDLVLRDGDRRVVVEHKTSVRKYTSDQCQYDPQLTAYHLAGRQLGLGDVGLRYQVITKTKKPTVQVEDVSRGERDEADFLRAVTGVLRAVGTRAFWPNRGWQCRSCPFAHACEARP